MREHVTKQSTLIRIFFFQWIKIIANRIDVWDVGSSLFYLFISSRIDNNNFHLGFLRKTKEKEDEREREERDGFEERERPGRV